MNPKPVVLVVRIWPVQGGFKASARAADSEETLFFATPEELLRYLAESVASPANWGGGAGGGKQQDKA